MIPLATSARRRLLVVAGCAALATAGCPSGPGEPVSAGASPLIAAIGDGVAPSYEPAVFSLLAVGDTGEVPVDGVAANELIVAKAMVADDAQAPVDALVFLGDNFYRYGLQWEEVVERIRANLVTPYCHFQSLTGVLSDEVVESCAVDVADRHPVPIYAVTGNHDRRAPESPLLQRIAVPWFVSNWRMPEGAAQVFEVGDSISLVAFDADEIYKRGNAAPLREAIRSARGPWRILVAHRPIATARAGGYTEKERFPAYVAAIHGAIDDAGVPVQLFLSGHDHYLAATMGERPPLNIISGAGSSPRDQELAEHGCLFRSGNLGFARIDLVEDGEGGHLITSLVAAAGTNGERRLLARWSIDASGHPTRIL